MKKSLIALSIVSVFSFSSVAATPNFIHVEDVQNYIATKKREGDIKVWEVGNTTIIEDNAGKTIGHISKTNNGYDVFYDGQKSEIKTDGNKIVEIDGKFAAIDSDSNGIIDISNGNEDQVFDKAAKASERISKGETVVEIRDGQGKVIETIDAHNVHKYQKEFMELSDSEKIKRLQEIEAAAKNGQIIEGNTPSPRPEPTDPTVDDAMDWVNERINGAGREVAIAAAQYDARLDSLEANFNAMAERQPVKKCASTKTKAKCLTVLLA
ncbi:hypothetical protein [Vibrio nigripulchritudo]|uniref:hypothetical protein n=1 Tax=Vibrio nigripulchritudo TaxID=28173 RepID=UPI0003B235BE|nr:hypothetical protein [Vibrio nigripulchritudo]CCN69497.1 exported hypothetical protein [Vibrio nigripulchritudo SFn118]